jgi:hypothetical protein
MLFLLLVCQPQPISAHDEESLLLVSQGVISRNYDDSQYDGFDS